MHTAKRKFLLILLFITLSSAVRSQSLTVYQRPSNSIEQSGKYTVEITQGEKHVETFVYITKSGSGSTREWGNEQNKSFHYTSFSFNGPITIQVTKFKSSATTAVIRPERSDIGTIRTTNSTNGKRISFTLTHPAKLSVEFQDDLINESPLTIFANELERREDIPTKSSDNVFLVSSHNNDYVIPRDKNIVFFPPGVFVVNYWKIPSYVQQVYISGGAYLRGYLFAERQKNNPLKINGRGIVSGDIFNYHYPENVQNDLSLKKYISGESARWYKMIEIRGGSKNIIEGITIVDATAYNIVLSSDSSIIRNVNINGYRFNNDAITVGGNNNKIDNCYIRVNEDAIVLYGNSTTISNCVFWQLSNSTIQLGWMPHKITGQNVIEHCDIIHMNNQDGNNPNINSGFITAMNLTPPQSPNSVIENFTVSDIRFDTPIEKFLDLRMNRNGKSQPNKFSNFVFKDIYIKSSSKHALIYLDGFDSTHNVSGFSFFNFIVNQKRLSKEILQEGRIIDGDSFVKELRIN